MPAILDHIFEFVGRLTPKRSDKRFFAVDAWGNLDLARDVHAQSLTYFHSKSKPPVDATLRRDTACDIAWAPPSVDADYGDGVVRQDATFVSPFADALPEESRLVRFARLRPGAPPASGTDGAASAVKRVAVLLPCTGDVDEWFRRSIARELLTNGVECVIPTIAYYGERKPARQWRHVLRSVADAKIQLSVTPVEMMMLCMALDEEAKRDGHASVDLCLAGVSLGGTMSALTALAMAKARGDAENNVVVCCVAAANDCTPYVEGSIETRLAWEVLCESGEADGATPMSKERCKTILLDVLKELDMSNLVVKNAVKGAVCVTAREDRFVGAGDAIAKTLQTMVTTAEGFIREDFDGGHLQFLFGNKSSIAPNIQRAFDLMRA
jgi:hypothetical protein